jgi:hypothetical protein
MAVAVGAGRVGQVLLAGEHEGPFRHPAGAMDRSAAALSAPGPPRWTVPARRQAWLVKGTPARTDPTGRGWMVRAACFLRLERVHEARELIYLQICRSIS